MDILNSSADANALADMRNDAGVEIEFKATEFGIGRGKLCRYGKERYWWQKASEI